MNACSRIAPRSVVCALGLALLSAIALSIPGNARAENDQQVVLGAGFGIHTFSKSDDLRAGSGFFVGGDEVKQAGFGQLYLEWYLLDTLGIGLRSINLGVTRTYTTSLGSLEQEWNTGIGLVTLHWVPIGGQSYTRFGLIAGVGAANYKVTETALGVSTSAEAQGSASLLGAYIDWGAEDFGARFGAHSISTSLDKLKVGSASKNVDASGTAWYFDLRWAFGR